MSNGIDFTHHVALVLDNDEGLYHDRLRMVAEALTDEYPNALLQDLLRDFVEQLVYGWDDNDETPSIGMMARELLGCALSSVNWYELAERYIDEAREEA